MHTMDDSALILVELAQRFAQRELAPRALTDDRYPFATFCQRSWELSSETGLCAVALPEAYGGAALGMAAVADTLETIAAVDASKACVLFCQALARALLVALGPVELSQRVATLRSDASDSLIAYPLYEDPEEPSEGVSAQYSGAGLVLSGELAQVACLPVADSVIVPALLGGERALFLLDTRLPGLMVSDPLVMLGLRACPVADLVLHDVVVSDAQRLGDAEAGATWARVTERFRPALVAMSLGVLRGSYELALAYARERYQAKKRIVEHHMVQEMLAGMRMVIETGALALPSACARADSQQFGSELLSLQELVTAAVARAASEGVQVLGGNGYIHEYGQEKRMRDAKQLQAVFGSSATRTLRVIERHLRAASGRDEPRSSDQGAGAPNRSNPS